MFDPGAWGRPRSVGLQLPPRVRVKRVVYAHARALGQRNVNGNGAFVRCPRPRMRQQRCCFGAAKMGQGDGRSKVGLSLDRTPLESVELVTVRETLSLKESAAAPQGEIRERAVEVRKCRS